MRKVTLLVLVALLLGSVAPVLGQTGEAPAGTFYGAWPYFMPPDGT